MEQIKGRITIFFVLLSSDWGLASINEHIQRVKILREREGKEPVSLSHLTGGRGGGGRGPKQPKAKNSVPLPISDISWCIGFCCWVCCWSLPP